MVFKDLFKNLHQFSLGYFKHYTLRPFSRITGRLLQCNRFSKNSKTITSNNRPISLLSVIDKIMESIINLKVFKYLNSFITASRVPAKKDLTLILLHLNSWNTFVKFHNELLLLTQTFDRVGQQVFSANFSATVSAKILLYLNFNFLNIGGGEWTLFLFIQSMPVSPTAQLLDLSCSFWTANIYLPQPPSLFRATSTTALSVLIFN